MNENDKSIKCTRTHDENDKDGYDNYGDRDNGAQTTAQMFSAVIA